MPHLTGTRKSSCIDLRSDSQSKVLPQNFNISGAEGSGLPTLARLSSSRTTTCFHFFLRRRSWSASRRRKRISRLLLGRHRLCLFRRPEPLHRRSPEEHHHVFGPGNVETT